MNKRLLTFCLVPACALCLLTAAQAQEGRPPGQFGPRAGGGFTRPSPLQTALDANSDGLIDEKEMAGASEALKKLDRNGDGKLTQDEFTPTMPGRGGPAPAAANADALVTRLMQNDKNGDEKLSKDELPERMQSMMDTGDTDKDGFLTREEIRRLSQSQNNAAPARGAGGSRGERDSD